VVVGLEESRTQFLTVSGVDLAESNNQFHYRLVVFFSHLKSKSGIFSSRRKKLEEITDSHTLGGVGEGHVQGKGSGGSEFTTQLHVKCTSLQSLLVPLTIPGSCGSTSDTR
jgi:hypothetical protein